MLSKVDIFDIRNNLTSCQTSVWLLWIALKSWYLWYSEQLEALNNAVISSCELLSKVDIFDIRNNFNWPNNLPDRVVNCSQKLISLIFGTTHNQIREYDLTLWIALKSWYLWYSEQLSRYLSRIVQVVNCSQKLISLIFGTTFCI